jgi:hypothetical protein
MIMGYAGSPLRHEKHQMPFCTVKRLAVFRFRGSLAF